MSAHLVYTLRPENTALWLPERLAKQIGAGHGQRLTDAQYHDAQVQDLIARRLRRGGNEERE